MEHYLRRISTLDYVVVQEMDVLSENCDTIANLDLSQINNGEMDYLLQSRDH